MTEHKNLFEALAAAQGEFETLKKDGTNPHFNSKFTPLDTVVEHVRPILAKHGLSFSVWPCYGPDQKPAIRYKLAHGPSKEFEEETMPLLNGKQDPQGMGGALTYARRYAQSAVLNLVSDDDDDGNRGSVPPPKTQQRPANGNGAAATPGKLATAADIKAMDAASKTLSVGDIKLALGACGLDGVTAFAKVPADKVVEVTKALAKATT